MNNLYESKMDDLYRVYRKFEKEEKQTRWNMAIGLNQIDNLKPSIFLEQLIQKYVCGNIDIQTLEKILEDYYNNNLDLNIKQKECDLVSSRIVELVSDNEFDFSIETLKNIHNYLFNNIYDFAGKYRRCNLMKKEVIIDNNSVKYADFMEIKNLLIYDFNSERESDITKLSFDKKIKHFAKFTSDIWQVHPFREGNTRAVTVFMIKYLNSLGYKINNELFKENSSYFRNALVLSNYYNYSKGIKPNFEYLYEFYNHLLYNSKTNINTKSLCKKINL